VHPITTSISSSTEIFVNSRNNKWDVLRQSLCVVSQAHSLSLARGLGLKSGDVEWLLKEEASQSLDTRYGNIARGSSYYSLVSGFSALCDIVSTPLASVNSLVSSIVSRQIEAPTLMVVATIPNANSSSISTSKLIHAPSILSDGRSSSLYFTVLSN
jgi:hypothetical protein